MPTGIPAQIDINILKKLYLEENKTVVDIAKYFKCHRDTIYSRLRQHNITREDRLNIKQLTNLYCEKNYNISQLCNHFNITNQEFIVKRLKKYNIVNTLKENIRELWIQGYTSEEIAKKLDLSQSEIEYNLKHHSIYKSKTVLDKIDYDTFYNQYINENKKLSDLADFYKCSERIISEYITRNNLYKNTKKFYFDYNEIYKLYIEDNLTMDEIAERFNCCRKTINNFITEVDIYKTNRETSIERKIKELLEKYNIEYEKNTRKIISPLELDFYIPKHNLAIETCGLYWHSELKLEDKNYHLYKFNKCLNKNIKLLTIFEDEINNKWDIISSRILYNLYIYEGNKIYARNCTVKEISNRSGIDFLNKYHLQGSGSNNVYLGAFFDNSLVSVMSFRKSNVAKGNYTTDIELNRFASKGVVVGIASKLFKYFLNNYSYNNIISYADKRFGVGNLYTHLGFEELSDTEVNYYYIDNKIRKHRYSFTKHKLQKQLNIYDNSLTERDLAKLANLVRIYDCGNKKYIYKGK